MMRVCPLGAMAAAAGVVAGGYGIKEIADKEIEGAGAYARRKAIERGVTATLAHEIRRNYEGPEYDDRSLIAVWNDQEDRTQDEVLELFDSTIAQPELTTAGRAAPRVGSGPPRSPAVALWVLV